MHQFIFLLVAPAAFAQIDPFTITVTASRSIPIAPDQAVVRVTVATSQNTSLSDVLGFVNQFGLNSTTFVATTSFFSGPGVTEPSLSWLFSAAVPISQLPNMLAKLEAQQGSGANPGFSLLFYIINTQASPELLASQPCPLPALVADARAQAARLAKAAGFGVGDISTISDGGSTNGGTQGALFSTIVPQQAAWACAIVVKFKLTLS